MKLEYTVKKEEENTKLKYILKNILHISTALLVKLKNNKCIFVNNNICMVNTLVKENDTIIVDLNNIDNDSKSTVIPYDKEMNIIYEDEYMLVIDKPSNLEIHPSSNSYDKTLANMIMNYYNEMNYNINKIHIITRLDKDTSGICIIVKNEYIQNLFSNKSSIQKEYIAIVNGNVKKNHDIIEKNIARKKGSIIIREVNDKGDYCKTEYFVLYRNIDKNYTYLKILLHTGRTHQIRVHMAYIGHVILR
ncbi:MAG: RluA family pseudouridine synthase [Clostridia bacterium]|nr:RluA family pseudouridine synthase [Clostridia bacterium]MDD4387360.1 RluA family pseudouridine synthase [Clostridia bacterium]